jgi:hypothetical protein
VDSGPPDTYQLLVAVLDGYGSTTPLTPRRRPAEPLVFPLRFAIRFAEFDAAHMGSIRFTVESLDGNGDSTGYLLQTAAIKGDDHDQISVSLGAAPDMGQGTTEPADLAEPDLARPDLAGAQVDLSP